MKRSLFLLLAILFILSGCTNSASASASSALTASARSTSSNEATSPLPEPKAEPKLENIWVLDTPENHSMNPEILTQLHEALARSAVYAMVTAKDGVIIDEYYQDGYDETSTFALHSCSKSFTSALTGIALDQGLIGEVDDLLSSYLPQVLELEDTDKQKLTLRHLLTHTSGLEWYEWGGGTSNWAEFRSAPNWVDYILGRRLVAQPDTQFNYGTGTTHLMTAALEKAVGMNALEYGKINLFNPLGMDSVEWGTDPQGVVDGGNGIIMTARDAARFGQLYLNGGVWNGEQLISSDWVEKSTAVQNAGPGGSTGEYGYSWWVRPFTEANYETYYAFGAWGQYIFIVPELNLVTVIASNYPEDSYAPRPYFTDYILAAYEG